MENLLGFIVFVAIVAISIINKIRTEAKAGQEQQEQRDSPFSLDEMPEATRRMLYGDGGDILVARPRGKEPERRATPAQPHPVAARRVEVGDERPQQTQQTQPNPFAQARSATHPEPQPSPLAQTQQATRTATPPLRQPMQQTMRQQPQQTITRPQPKTPMRPVQQPVHTAAHTTVKPAVKPMAKIRIKTAGVGADAGSVSMSALLASKNDLARGILLREILGPPKAFEEFA